MGIQERQTGKGTTFKMAQRFGSPQMFDTNSKVRRRREDPELVESVISNEAFYDCIDSSTFDLFTLDNSILISRKVILNALNDLVVDQEDNLLESWIYSYPFEYHCIAALWDSGWVRKIFNKIIELEAPQKSRAVKDIIYRLNRMDYD